MWSDNLYRKRAYMIDMLFLISIIRVGNNFFNIVLINYPEKQSIINFLGMHVRCVKKTCPFKVRLKLHYAKK